MARGYEMRQSKTKLVKDLLTKPESLNRDRMVQRARSGYYHPDTSPVGSPRRQCVVDLLQARFADLAANVEAGVYD